MAGNTFSGAPLTTNQAFDPSQNQTTAHLRALNLGGLARLDALGGTTGVNVELVHAACCQQITGNVTTNITGDNRYTLTGNSTPLITGPLTETINNNHDYKVLTNLTLYVKGTTTEENVGKHILSNTGPVTESFVGSVDRYYEAETTEEHPESWFEKVSKKFHFEPFKYESFGFVASAAAIKTDVMGASVCVRHTGIGVGAEQGEFKLQKFKLVKSEEELHEAIIETFALRLHLGAMDAGTPFKSNTLPRPTPLTPFD